jgi:hypothetical protein
LGIVTLKVTRETTVVGQTAAPRILHRQKFRQIRLAASHSLYGGLYTEE